MKHATSKALYAYWESCQGRAGIAANAIPAELASVLPSIFLLDVEEGWADLRFRFCGPSVATRYGRDLSQDSFLDLWSTEDRRNLRRDIRVLARRSCGLVAGVLGETVGAGFVSFEMLLLPLAGATGVSGAIGCMARVGGHEETNRIRARLVSQTLSSVRFLSPPVRARIRSVPDASWRPAAAQERRYGHLTLLPGGR